MSSVTRKGHWGSFGAPKFESFGSLRQLSLVKIRLQPVKIGQQTPNNWSCLMHKSKQWGELLNVNIQFLLLKESEIQCVVACWGLPTQTIDSEKCVFSVALKPVNKALHFEFQDSTVHARVFRLNDWTKLARFISGLRHFNVKRIWKFAELLSQDSLSSLSYEHWENLPKILALDRHAMHIKTWRHEMKSSVMVVNWQLCNPIFFN